MVIIGVFAQNPVIDMGFLGEHELNVIGSMMVLQSFFDSILKIYCKDSMRVAEFYKWINALDYKKNDPLSLSVTTSFNGSRSNPFVRGVIENISSTNLTAGNLALGFVQGICNEIYDFYNLIRRH